MFGHDLIQGWRDTRGQRGGAGLTSCVFLTVEQEEWEKAPEILEEFRHLVTWNGRW